MAFINITLKDDSTGNKSLWIEIDGAPHVPAKCIAYEGDIFPKFTREAIATWKLNEENVKTVTDDLSKFSALATKIEADINEFMNEV